MKTKRKLKKILMKLMFANRIIVALISIETYTMTKHNDVLWLFTNICKKLQFAFSIKLMI